MTPTAAADTSLYSDASSLWVVVNKSHALNPLKYAPKLATVDDHEVDVRMAPHLQALLDAARANDTPLHVVSGYRSYDYQVGVYTREVARLGKAQADRLSARPGHSEHQTGLAADLDNIESNGCQLDDCFGNTAGGKWLATHASEFGFVVRYTVADEAITGYSPEPWHIRYVGTELAAKLYANDNETLEQYFGVTGGNYPDEQDPDSLPSG